MLFCVLILSISDQVKAYEKTHYNLDQADQLFLAFKIKYNKTYADETEHMRKFEIFKETLKNINALNEKSEPPYAVHDINEFSDRTKDELFPSRVILLQGDMKPPCKVVEGDDIYDEVSSKEAHESLDWRAKHAVTRVKQQGDCGSCWAFSVTGVIEGAYAIKHRKLVELSEQQILDCSLSSGCSGGWPMEGIGEVIKLGGLMSEKKYPYVEKKHTCGFEKNATVAKVTACTSYENIDEEMLKDLLTTNGPLSLALDFSSLLTYRGGIVKECPGDEIGHAVLLVGYGTEKGVPYWIIKNSFGPQFGEEGYVRIKRGINACGLITESIISASVR